LAVFFGKAVKMAQKAPCTHAGKTALSLKALSRWCREDGGSGELAKTVAACNTAREAFFHLIKQWPSGVDAVGKRLIRAAEKFCENRMRIGAVIFDFDENPVWRSDERRWCK
jgi:cobalt-precorrin-5B (C1)-methyltransferase